MLFRCFKPSPDDIISKKEIRSQYFVIMIDLVSALMMNFFDSIMVSSCGESAVAGVSLVSQLVTLISSITLAYAVGGGAVIAQYYGKGDTESSCECAKQLVYTLLMMMTVVVLLCEVFEDGIVRLFFGSAEDSVMDAALDYYFWIMLSFIPFSVFAGCSNALRAFGRPKDYVKTAMVANMMNVVGNAIAIYVLGWGVAGAAISTLVARIYLAAGALASITSKKNTLRIKKLFHYRFDFSRIGRIARLSLPNALESGLQQLGKTIVFSLMSTLPTAQIASYSVAAGLGLFMEYPPGGMDNTMVGVIGRCCGAGRNDEAFRHGKCAILNVYGMMLPLSAVFIVFARPFVSLYNVGPEAASLAVVTLRVYALACLLLYAESWAIAPMLRASGDVRFTMPVTIILMWLSRVVFGSMFVKRLGWGVWGVWAGMYLDWILRSIFFTGRFFSGKWRNHSVV